VSTNFRMIATIGLALVFSAMCMSPVMAQQAPETVKQPLRVIQYNGDMANILSQLPGIYHRTIGLEVDPRHQWSTVDFYLKDPTLVDVLNAITKSAPIYQWSDKQDFIEVVPVRGGTALLDTRISSFRVDYADESEAINQLLNLPEVQASMTAMRLRYKNTANPLAAGSGKKMSFAVQDVTIRQVLNKIANENGSRFWIMKRNIGGLFSIGTVPNLSLAQLSE